ncbi:hypothetical protein EON65_01560 [archaeon]|nr:MAG: hypothetical protein EON65_01560 [archaeon]
MLFCVFVVIGHTRFATSSINQVPELHPHEWVPFHDELVWLFNPNSGRFENLRTKVGLHISHNGDFDAMEAFSQVMVVDEVGLWLERVLHVPNSTKGDSPKIAGCMDLMRVQGRWAAAARLAYVRCITQVSTDVCGGNQLSKQSPNTFPSWELWDRWGDVFDKEWAAHINNIVKVIAPSKFEVRKKKSYSLDNGGVKQFEDTVVKAMQHDILNNGILSDNLNIKSWTSNQLISFVHFTIRGFLRSDLYNVMTELLSRAEGSFGLQAHCSLEPGVVVIASKGQPMSFAFDPMQPIVLFASEAEALAVPVYKSGRWLPERIDLDSHGEIVRLGEARYLQEGSYADGKKKKKSKSKKLPEDEQQQVALKKAKRPFILLDCGVEIRSYSLVTCMESTMESLISRSVTITSAPIPYDPNVDLVAEDLRITPAVLSAIDRAWSNAASMERQAGEALATCLVNAMYRRATNPKDTIDLLIGGVEVSLWLAEQFAADLRRIFPHLNVATASANKLLGMGEDNPSKVFFPVSDDIPSRKIDSNTCVLLVSQSGQTFATLHATRKMAKFVPDRLWILTGCFNSKMQQALLDSYKEHKIIYHHDRVFNNFSGHRPAEPSSVAVAATWHTLTRMLLRVIHVTRHRYPSRRIIHPWDYDEFAYVVQRFFLSIRGKMREKLGLKSSRSAVSAGSELVPSGSSKGSRGEKKDQEEMWFQLSQDYDDDDDELPYAKLSKSLDLKTLSQRSASMNAIIDKKSPLMSRTLSFRKAGESGDKRNLIMKTRQASSKKYSIKAPTSSDYLVIMNLSDGCVEDIKSLMTENLIPNICQIVGHDHFGAPMLECTNEDSTYAALVKQGEAWAEHINENWHIIVLVAIYLFFSVGLGLPIFGLIGDAILSIVRAAGAPVGEGILAFTPRTPHIMYNQPIGYTLIGLLLQILDAIFFIYLGKNFTIWTRILHGRPLAARHGKRTIVIVDNPCVHQLTEIFVSKLFSQAYSFVSVDVHGASGLDHFVHRFTHRVVRGLLIAVGRPDGRLGCLGKHNVRSI